MGISARLVSVIPIHQSGSSSLPGLTAMSDRDVLNDGGKGGAGERLLQVALAAAAIIYGARNPVGSSAPPYRSR